MALAGTDNLNSRIVVAYLTFFFIALTLPCAFLYEKGARILFYWSAVFSIVGIIIEKWNNIRFSLPDKKAIAFLLLGMLFSVWSFYASHHSPSATEFYFTPGKRCLLAFIMIAYIAHITKSGVIKPQVIKRLSYLSLIAAFFSASSYAIVQAVLSDDRVVMGINRATMSAYIYSVLSLVIMKLLVDRKKGTAAIMAFFGLASLSLYVITLTQTRAAMIMHLVFILILFLQIFSSTKGKTMHLLFAVAMLVTAALSHHVIVNRLEGTVTEYSAFTHGNDQTSLGSRFTLWKVGMLAFEQSPLGQTQETRNAFIKDYLSQHGNSHSWALLYINVHLHNEFIQYASLFGLAGVGGLLWFFSVFAFMEIKHNKSLTPLAIMGLLTLLYGMTDVLMTSVEYIVVFSVLTVLVSTLTAERDR